jgi:hypothetical protein
VSDDDIIDAALARVKSGEVLHAFADVGPTLTELSWLSWDGTSFVYRTRLEPFTWGGWDEPVYDRTKKLDERGAREAIAKDACLRKALGSK